MWAIVSGTTLSDCHIAGFVREGLVSATIEIPIPHAPWFVVEIENSADRQPSTRTAMIHVFRDPSLLTCEDILRNLELSDSIPVLDPTVEELLQSLGAETVPRTTDCVEVVLVDEHAGSLMQLADGRIRVDCPSAVSLVVKQSFYCMTESSGADALTRFCVVNFGS